MVAADPLHRRSLLSFCVSQVPGTLNACRVPCWTGGCGLLDHLRFWLLVGWWHRKCIADVHTLRRRVYYKYNRRGFSHRLLM